MNEITIEYLARLLMRRLIIVILAAVIFAGAAFGYNYFLVQPIYKATSQIIVSNGAVIIEDENTYDPSDTSKINGSDIQSSIYLAKVCESLLETQDFYKKLAEKLDNKYTHAELNSYTSVELNREEDLFLNISVNHKSIEEAQKIANTMVNMAPDYLNEYMPTAKVMITAVAEKSAKVHPRTFVNTVAFFVVGAGLSYLLVLFVDLNDKSIKGVGDFSECYNIPVLGSVPNFESTDAQGGYSYAEKQ